MRISLASLTLVFVALLAISCATSKKILTPRLSKLEGKKVALIDIEGETTAKSVVEVALVNQLLQKGSFTLIGKKEVEAARLAPDQNPLDFKTIAKRVGADYALLAKVLEFSAEEKEGYSAEEVEDSQLAAERGKAEGKTHRLFKVKALHGKIRVELKFIALSDGDIRTGVAESDEQLLQDQRKEAIHLPPKLRFLEKTANIAFKNFFEKYQ